MRIICAVTALLVASVASAQPREPRLTASAGLTWTGGYGVGDGAASLRTNAPGSTPPGFVLFRAASGFESDLGFASHLGFRLTDTFSMEAGLLYGSPRLTTEVSADAEGAQRISLSEESELFVADMAVVWRLRRQWGPRARPFLSGGFGLLRQIHEGRSLLESGVIYHVGAGAQLMLHGNGGRGRPAGLRGEFRTTLRQGGIDVENKLRVYPSLSIVSFVGF